MLLAAERSASAGVKRSQALAHLDDESWRTLVRINRRVNGAIAPDTDLDIYGQDEVWALPLSRPEPGVASRGDCEDYALEKRQRLLAAGWPAESLSLVTVVIERASLHVLLVVHTDRGDFALDNLHAMPVALEHLDYIWISQQTGGALLDWSYVTHDTFDYRTLTAPSRGGAAPLLVAAPR